MDTKTRTRIHGDEDGDEDGDCVDLWFSMSISELADDGLWNILSGVHCGDLDAPNIQIPVSQRTCDVYDPQLVAVAVDFPLLWCVCKRWKGVINEHVSFHTRCRLRDLLVHHSNVVLTTAERYCRRLKLWAAMPRVGTTLGFLERTIIKDCSLIIYPSVQSAVYSMLRELEHEDVRDSQDCLYKANLRRVVSDVIYRCLLNEFKKPAGVEERVKQAECYLWCSSTRSYFGRDTIVNLDHSVLIAKLLRTHPALCTYVARLSRATKYVHLHPEVADQLRQVLRVKRAVGRVIPVSFGIHG